MIYELRTYTLDPGQAGRVPEAERGGRPQDPRRQVRQARGLLDDRVRHAEPVRAPLELRRPQRARAAARRAREERGVDQGVRAEDPPADAGPGEQDPVAGRCRSSRPRTPATSTSCAGTARTSGQARRVAQPLQGRPARPREVLADVGVWQTEAGQLNEVVHLWVYKDLNERAAARAKAVTDPEWQTFLGKAHAAARRPCSRSS